MSTHFVTDHTKARIVDEFNGRNLPQLASRYDLSEGQVAEILEAAAETIDIGLPPGSENPMHRVFSEHMSPQEAAWLVQNLNTNEQQWLGVVFERAGALAGQQLASHMLIRNGVAPGPGYRYAPDRRMISTLDRILSVILPEVLQRAPLGQTQPAQADSRAPCARPVAAKA